MIGYNLFTMQNLIFFLYSQVINLQWHYYAEDCKDLFINISDSFAIPIGGERVTWGCLNG